MTVRIAKSKKKFFSLSLGRVAFWGICLGMLFLFLFQSEEAIRRVSEGLLLCAKNVIPALFPFMIVSSLIVSSGLLTPLSRLVSRPFRALFGVSGESGCAVLLGLLCGFPVATGCALTLYEDGRIGEREFCRLMTFANNPSIAFLVGGVGISLFGDRTLGLLLYLVTLSSAAFIGILSRWLFGTVLSPDPNVRPSVLIHKKSPFLIFTEAVTSSAQAMLSICAFVIFFSAFTGTLEHLLEGTKTPDWIRSLLFGFFEMTGGMARASRCPSLIRYYLCAAFAGWSGISVHFQIFSICAAHPSSFRPYLLAKFVQAILNVLFMGAGLAILGYV